MSGRPETPYTETEALLAVMRAVDAVEHDEDAPPDYSEAERLLADFLPGELRTLALAANELRLLIWRRYSVDVDLDHIRRRRGQQ